MDMKVLPKAISEAILKVPFTSAAFVKTVPQEIFAEAMGFYVATLVASKSNKNTRITREEHDAASLEKRTQVLKEQNRLSQKMKTATTESMRNIALLAKVTAPVA